MPHSPTPWYNFRLPEDEDLMSNPEIDITDSFEKIASAAAPVIITPGTVLPQTGYKWGQRVFQGQSSSTNSVHLCVCDDTSTWGNVWMPVQDQNSPWAPVPVAAIAGNFTSHVTYPLKMTMNNRGQFMFNGALSFSGGLTNDIDDIIFNQMPDGIRPPTDMSFMCTINPTVFDAGATYEKLRYARLDLRADGTSSIRVHGGTAFTTSELWLNQVRYFAGRNDYVAP